MCMINLLLPFQILFQQSMIGSIVLTDYNNKTYRVDDVDFSLNPLSTFLYKNNETLTYVEYYKRRYQITIKDVSNLCNLNITIMQLKLE